MVISLADRFNQLKVRRYADDLLTVVKEIPVGLNTMIPTKMHLERIEDYTSEGGESRFYQTEPFMNLNLTGMSRDSGRSISPHAERFLYTRNYDKQIYDECLSNMQPVPYNFTWSLSIRTNSYEDSSQILEQILPYFNDDAFLRIRELPFLNVERNLQVTLDGVSPDISADMGEEQMRSVNWTIDFTVKGFMYRPIADVGLIEKIRLIMEVGDEGTEVVDYTITGVRLGDWVSVAYGSAIPADALLLQTYRDVDNALMVKYKQPVTSVPEGGYDLTARDEFVATYKVKN